MVNMYSYFPRLLLTAFDSFYDRHRKECICQISTYLTVQEVMSI